MKRLLAACWLALLSVNGFAQVQPVVEVTVTPEQVRVGEALELQVTVLVPTWFAQPPAYPDFELANTVTQRPPDSSFPTSRTINGENWSGIVRSFRIYPLQAADYRIDGAELGVSYANPGAAPTRTTVPLPSVRFSAVVPAGAETLSPYLAGSALRLSVNISGDTGSLASGDAVTLEYRAELDGLPAIFLPPLAPALRFEGAAVYADRARTADGPPATRSEKLTLVFEAGGEFEVPPVTLSYWNTERGAVEQVTAEGARFRVSGPAPADSSAADVSGKELSWRSLVAVALAGLLFGALWRVWRRLLQPAWQTWRKHQLASEAHAFKVLQHALRANDNVAAYRALLVWSEHLQPPMPSRAFALRYGNTELASALDNLGTALFGQGKAAPAGSALARELRSARQQYHKARRARAAPALPPLNP
mgnify:CR=1 FL=1